MSEVKQIILSEAKKAAESLHKAFENDPLMQWLAVTPKNYEQNGQALFETWVNYGIRYGVALRTGYFEAVAIRRKPGDVKFGLWRMFRSGMFKTPKLLGKIGMQRLDALGTLCDQAKSEKMAKQKFWHCWVLGTRPDKQRQGFAKQLIIATFELAKKDNLPCYLETEKNSKAETVHSHIGYKRLMDIELPDSQVELTTMLY